jgi:glycolate oxidase FAD binding subunit
MNDSAVGGLPMDFTLSELCDRVMTARAGHKPVLVCGGGSKHFYGNPATVAPGDGHCQLDLTVYRGIVAYHPSELVVTVRAGTPLRELEQALAAEGQMLAFEPPHYGEHATVGGCVATGLAGPRRMAAGSVRDFVLGARLLDAQGRLLSFGGEVMKNVAGYDVSRLLTGSLGIFGALVEISLKVMPVPLDEITLLYELDAAEALARFTEWRRQPLPLTASCWIPPSEGRGRGRVAVRLSGASEALAAAQARLGGEALERGAADALWQALREQTHPFFQAGRPLWRLSLPPATAALEPGPALIEWGGGQRWLSGDFDAAEVRRAAQQAGGHATLFRAGDTGIRPADGVFHPASAAVAAITRRLKNELDPWGLFNPGKLAPEL